MDGGATYRVTGDVAHSPESVDDNTTNVSSPSTRVVVAQSCPGLGVRQLMTKIPTFPPVSAFLAVRGNCVLRSKLASGNGVPDARRGDMLQGSRQAQHWHLAGDRPLALGPSSTLSGLGSVCQWEVGTGGGNKSGAVDVMARCLQCAEDQRNRCPSSSDKVLLNSATPPWNSQIQDMRGWQPAQNVGATYCVRNTLPDPEPSGREAGRVDSRERIRDGPGCICPRDTPSGVEFTVSFPSTSLKGKCVVFIQVVLSAPNGRILVGSLGARP